MEETRVTCPKCRLDFSVKEPGITVGAICPHCSWLIDVSDLSSPRVVDNKGSNVFQSILEVGDAFRLKGKKFTVRGVIKYRDSDGFFWFDFFALSEDKEPLWITFEDDAWLKGETIPKIRGFDISMFSDNLIRNSNRNLAKIIWWYWENESFDKKDTKNNGILYFEGRDYRLSNDSFSYHYIDRIKGEFNFIPDLQHIYYSIDAFSAPYGISVEFSQSLMNHRANILSPASDRIRPPEFELEYSKISLITDKEFFDSIRSKAPVRKPVYSNYYPTLCHKGANFLRKLDDSLGKAFKITREYDEHGNIKPYEILFASGTYKFTKIFIILAIVINIFLYIFTLGNSKSYPIARFRFKYIDWLVGRISDPFELKDPNTPYWLEITVSGVNQSWIWTKISIIDDKNREILSFNGDEFYEYHGYDSDGYWEEQNSYTTKPFTIEKPGKYRIAITGEANSTEKIQDSISDFLEKHPFAKPDDLELLIPSYIHIPKATIYVTVHKGWIKSRYFLYYAIFLVIIFLLLRRCYKKINYIKPSYSEDDDDD